MVRWVECRPDGGKGCFAPCTGQDWAALKAFAHLIELYLYGDLDGRRSSISAMAAVVLAMQPQARRLAKTMIPHVADWSHENEIWGHMRAIDERVPEFNMDDAR